MNVKILAVSSVVLLLGGCAVGGVSLGVTNAGEARTQCADQSARQQMSPEQQRQFMHACMAGYGYGPDAQESKPFTVKMPSHQQQTH